ncbi:MAG: hypothetical protein V1917_03170 [Candidatus Gottesmanbacteria bacterium]
MKLLAVDLGKIGGTGPDAGLGPFGGTTFTGPTAFSAFTNAISAIIGLLTIVAAIWFLIQVTMGGISWITAAGDKAKLTEARDKISNAFIGLVVVVAGWAILALAGQFFGWDTILLPSSVGELIQFK